MHPIQIQPREVHLQIFGPVLAGKQQKHICKHKLVSVYLNDYMSSDILIEIQWLLQGDKADVIVNGVRVVVLMHFNLRHSSQLLRSFLPVQSMLSGNNLKTTSRLSVAAVSRSDDMVL